MTVMVGETPMLVPVTVPTPLSMLSVDAPDTVQLSVDLPPRTMVAGEAWKAEMTGAGTTVTVAVDDAEPEALVAVRVYVVVAAGETDTLVPVTAPTPLLMDIEVALLTDQDRVELPPAVMVAAEAEKLDMVGAELPPEDVACDFPEQPSVHVRARRMTQRDRRRGVRGCNALLAGLPAVPMMIESFRSVGVSTRTATRMRNAFS